MKRYSNSYVLLLKSTQWIKRELAQKKSTWTKKKAMEKINWT